MSTECGFIGIDIYAEMYSSGRIYMNIQESVTHSGCVGLPIASCSNDGTRLYDDRNDHRVFGFDNNDVSPEKCEQLLSEWLRQSRARLMKALYVVESNMADPVAIKAEASALCAQIKSRYNIIGKEIE